MPSMMNRRTQERTGESRVAERDRQGPGDPQHREGTGYERYLEKRFDCRGSHHARRGREDREGTKESGYGLCVTL